MASESIFAQIDDSIMARVDIEVDKIFQKSILSMTWLMIVGKLSPEDGPDIELLSDKGRAFMESSFFGAGITNVFPILRFIFPHWLGYNVQMDFFTTCNKIAKVRTIFEIRKRIVFLNLWQNRKKIMKLKFLNLFVIIFIIFRICSWKERRNRIYTGLQKRQKILWIYFHKIVTVIRKPLIVQKYRYIFSYVCI